MMSYEKWHSCIVNAAQDIGSERFQEEAWFPGGKVKSSPDEVYQALMEDCTPDLFFETYGKILTEEQLRSWRNFRCLLKEYYEQMPRFPDPRSVLVDPQWDLVRHAARMFVISFGGNDGGRS